MLSATMECTLSKTSSLTQGTLYHPNPKFNLISFLFYYRVKSINLASNMISGEGLELFLDDLIANANLKHLDIGVVEGSMRKNSLGI